MELPKETAEEYAQRMERLQEVISTIPNVHNRAPESQLSRRERRANMAAYKREQKKLNKSLKNIPDWLK